MHSSLEKPPILILGNKRDVEDNKLEVTEKDIMEFEKQYSDLIIEYVSARTGANVNEAIT